MIEQSDRVSWRTFVRRGRILAVVVAGSLALGASVVVASDAITPTTGMSVEDAQRNAPPAFGAAATPAAGERVLAMPGFSFRLRDPAGSPEIVGQSINGCVYVDGGSFDLLTAEVNLPDGAVVTNVRGFFFQADESQSQLIALSSFQNANVDTGSAPGLTDEVFADVAGTSGYQVAETGGSVTIDNENRNYVVQAEADSSSERFCGAEIYWMPPAGDVTHTVTPCPIYDSRPSKGGPGDFAANTTRTIDVIQADYSGQGGDNSDCGIPSSARGLVVAVTALNSATDGNFRVWPNGEPTPASEIFAITGGTRGTAVIPIEIGANESIKVRNGGSSSTSITIVVLGYLDAPA